ncbi:MAG TPA: SCO family protein, partial [Noviherbaspirillum sp.]|nr:SCO family protein [Noviherbaspirillum sp.]
MSYSVRRIAALALIAGSVLVAGCDRLGASGGTQFQNTDLTGLEYARGFELPDHNGQLRTLADFRGKAVVVFFGFTHCPDVCPSTMAEMAQVMEQLGPDAERVQVLFVSVDPQRDRPEILRH